MESVYVGQSLLAPHLEVANGFTALRRKFLLVSVAALAVLGASMGVSFTADTGVTQITAASTGGALPLVWSATYGTVGGLPAAMSTATAGGWKYATSGTGSSSMPTTPGWPVVVAGQAGSVSSAGDIGVIDATDTSATYLLVTIYITNMRPLALTYNSYSLPIRIYGSDQFLSGGAITWSASPVTDSNGINLATTYLTNTQGFETFKLPTGAGKYYAITLDAGGSYYPYQTVAGGATTPALYITAQRTS